MSSSIDPCWPVCLFRPIKKTVSLLHVDAKKCAKLYSKPSHRTVLCCSAPHCYGSRANLGPVSYGERENLRSIQENLDWHQHWIFVSILSNIHSSTFSNKQLGNYTRKLQGIPGWYWITCWSIICRVLFLDPKIFTYQH